MTSSGWWDCVYTKTVTSNYMKSKDEFKSEYARLQSQYLRLGKNVEDALKSFIEIDEIPYLNIYHRIKDFESFYEKISRKNYTDPFSEIEDICGVRIICYYASDIVKIENIVKREFNILETVDKSESLGLKEFAYRSLHNIVTIKEEWATTPNYRGLQNLKAEIQIRTILMHAWAEIEHKLNYKSDSQVPSHFQRKLFRLSAKFEEADEQFEELRDGINKYRKSIFEKAQIENKFDVTQELNMDSYITFINFHFPDLLPIEEFYLDKSFESYSESNISFTDMEEALKKVKPHFSEIAKDLRKSNYPNDVINVPTELIGFALQVTGKMNHEDTGPTWKPIVEKWKARIK